MLVPMKKDLDAKLARGVAEDFLKKTEDLYARVEIAGSLRRDEPVVHDVDFAVIPRGRGFEAWREKVKRRVESIGGSVISFGEVISNFLYRGVQVNLFICPSRDSWGVTLMWATGPKGHTIGMTIKARNKGLLINSQGIWTREEPPRLIPARTEREVGRLLDWKFKPPEARGKPVKKEPPAFY
jgi:DNA polymerase/3'-5' exonuclease PolX